MAKRPAKEPAGAPAPNSTPLGTSAAPPHPAKARGEALSDAASVTKRSAENLIEQEENRARTMAGIAGGGGILAALFILCGALGIGDLHLMMVLSAAALLVPTGYAFAQTYDGRNRIVDAAYERGLCQALAIHAKRLAEAVGSADRHNVPLGPEAVINGQLDIIYKDLARLRQRLREAGVDAGQRDASNRLNARIVPENTAASVTASDGRRYPVRITDLSQSGVAIKGWLPPLYHGEEVQVGARGARVMRLTPGGAALQFLMPILPSEFTSKIVL